jgi:hypothetical protein
MFWNRDSIRESLSALVRLMVLSAALMMIGAVLVGPAWVYNGYRRLLGRRRPIVIVAIWVERNTPVIAVYEANVEDAPEPGPGKPVRRAVLSRRAVPGPIARR